MNQSLESIEQEQARHQEWVLAREGEKSAEQARQQERVLAREGEQRSPAGQKAPWIKEMQRASAPPGPDQTGAGDE